MHLLAKQNRDLRMTVPAGSEPPHPDGDRMHAVPPGFPSVLAINPDAGRHSITEDPRELEAALRAGDESWRQYPYYEWRFGERGRRFGHSDSAWIVGLTQYGQQTVDQQIRWLGSLLSPRGIPQWLLEQHLAVVYDALTAAVPERQEAYAVLRGAAAMLSDSRRTHLPDDTLQALDTAFEQQVGEEWRERRKGIGSLLAAAVADEKAGITRAVSNLEEWLTNPAQFSPEWIRAVRETIRIARLEAR